MQLLRRHWAYFDADVVATDDGYELADAALFEQQLASAILGVVAKRARQAGRDSRTGGDSKKACAKRARAGAWRAGSGFEAGRHMIVSCPPPCNHPGCAVVLHRQLMERAQSNSDQGGLPWVEPEGGNLRLFACSVYLPHQRSPTGSWSPSLEKMRCHERQDTARLLGGDKHPSALYTFAKRSGATMTTVAGGDDCSEVDAFLDCLRHDRVRLLEPRRDLLIHVSLRWPHAADGPRPLLGGPSSGSTPHRDDVGRWGGSGYRTHTHTPLSVELRCES